MNEETPKTDIESGLESDGRDLPKKDVKPSKESDYKSPMTSTQIAWRIGLVLLGLIIGIILFA